MMMKLARSTGLITEIDRRVHLLKVHAPYQESNHVMAHVLNMLCGGTRLEHLELLRNNEALLNAVGTDSIPDPTTAGDFCRRFMADDLNSLTSAIHSARLNVWRQQPDQFFNEAVIDVDGVIVGTTGECKEGMDISYKKIWGYHPLLVSFANEWWSSERTSRRNRVKPRYLMRLVTLFYISNDDKSVPPEQIVINCNKRCDQENLIAQLKSGVRSLCGPTDSLLSNGAYMLMTSLAWTLKAWFALLLPMSPRHRPKHEAERTRLLTMEFRTFLDLMIHVPCQIIRHARKTIYRLLNWTDLTPVFFRLCDSLQI
jgi:hypothetical protein